MPYCPTHGVQPGKYCPECGALLSESAPPTTMGDSVRVVRGAEAIASANPTFVLPGSHVETRPALVVCPKCGRRSPEADTFNCQGGCGRVNLCLRHFDEEMEICIDCVRTQRGATKAVNDRQARVLADPERVDTAQEPDTDQRQFREDCQRLADSDYSLEAVISHETVFIVTGCWIGAELVDRPTAYVLQQAINAVGAGIPFRRAVVIGDIWWRDHPEQVLKSPVIAVGGPNANTVTELIASKGEKRESNGCHSVLWKGQNWCLALWGIDALETRQAVTDFIACGDLADFLGRCWKQDRETPVPAR